MNLYCRSVQSLAYGIVFFGLASLEPRSLWAIPTDALPSTTTSAKDLILTQQQEQTLERLSDEQQRTPLSPSINFSDQFEVQTTSQPSWSLPNDNFLKLKIAIAPSKRNKEFPEVSYGQSSLALTIAPNHDRLQTWNDYSNQVLDNQTNSTNISSISRKINQYYKMKVLVAQAENSKNEPTPDPSISPSTNIELKEINLTGNTVFSTEELQENWYPFLNQKLNNKNLEDLTQIITQKYLDQGYLNSRAVLKNISPDGVVTIEIKEGKLGEIIIEGTDRLQDYIRQRVAMGAGNPLNIKNLEDQLRLLKSDSLFESVDASLRPPSLVENLETDTAVDDSYSILVVRVVEAKPFFGQVSLDNYSAPSIGAERFGTTLGYRNLGGLGDTLIVSYRPRLEAITGTYRVDTYYQVPLNPMNGTIAVSTLLDRNKILTDSFTPLNIRGNSERYLVEYRQPLIRTVNEELALSFGVSYDSGQTFALDQGIPFGFGPNAEGFSESSPLIFSQDYISRSPEGIWAIRSQFRFGTGLFGATSNPSPIPDGYFFAWVAQAQRLQVINEDNLFIAQLDLQLTPDPLLPMEQFAIGGAQSVRGYRQNVLAADNGIRLSLEDRITLVRDDKERTVFTLAPFFDVGAVWMASGNPNQVGANNNIIAGLGLGLIYQPIPNLNVRVDYAPPLMNLNIRGNNIQDDGLYLSINYDF